MTKVMRVRPEWIRYSLLLSFLISGCDSVSPAVPDEIQMSGAEQLRVGVQEQFSASLFSRGQRIPKSSFLWSSSNPNIIAVDGNGRTTPLSRGSSTISASAVDAPFVSRLMVSVLGIQSITVQPSVVSLEAGDVVQLSAQIVADAGTPSGLVEWISSNVSVATISQLGLLIALQPGQVTITAKGGGIIGVASVLVSAVAVASVRLDQTAATLLEGERLTLSATSLDKRGNALSGRAVSWESSNPSVASVTSGGVITAVSAGRASITVRSDGQTASAQLEVKRRTVASVAIQSSGNYLSIGGNLTLSAVSRDLNGNVLPNSSVVWTSSRPMIASVSASGLVSGVSLGSTTITAAVEGVQASLGVSVGVGIGTRLTGLASTNGDALFDLAVPANLPSLIVRTYGGSGTMDLFLLDPNGRQMCNSYSFSSTNSICIVYGPVAGRWRARLGYSFSGVTLDIGPTVPVMNLGQSFTGLSSSSGSPVVDINVPAGSPSLAVRTFAGSGTMDQYLYSPSGVRVCNAYSFSGTNTLCVVTNPQAGNWRVVLGYTFSGVTLQSTF
jgi:uncharacterized protein YjdB